MLQDQSQQKILVTGATGFVGTQLIPYLQQLNYPLVTLGRKPKSTILDNEKYYQIDLRQTQELERLISGVNVVIHLAAKVHDMNNTSWPEYYELNTELTTQLAKVCANQGVKQFIYLSTIKVHGEQTQSQPFSEIDAPIPQDPYARSKWLAEQQIMQICQQSQMNWTIIRPPLIYGHQVRANFKNLVKLIDLNIPLPFQGIQNRRSLLALDNLVEFIALCIQKPEAKNQLFCLADFNTHSTTQIIQVLQAARNNNKPLWYCPKSLLKIICIVLRRKSIFDRLFQSLEVDSTKAYQVMQFRPRFDFQEASKLYFNK